MQLRLLDSADLRDLMTLKDAAGWNQTEEDWLRMLRLSPRGCFGIETDGVVAASATVVCYGEDLAWIGMVLTLPDYRGRGFARRLMEAVLEVSGTRPVRLDASDMGKPLYESMGFVAECAVERWLRPPAPHSAELEVEPLRFDVQLDREVFGADRSALLAELAEVGASVGASYTFFRPGSMADYFGPCVAQLQGDGARLLEWHVAQHGASRPLALDLFPHHEQTAAKATELGFQPFRRLTRMVKEPAPVQLPDARTFSIAGFEWG